MTRFLLSFSLLLISAGMPESSTGQLLEDFADGDLTADPVWSGTLDRWIISRTADGSVLQSQGLPVTDTLTLSTTWRHPFAEWRLRLIVRNGRLSSANQVRIYLIADTSTEEGPWSGYYLLAGSNDRTLRLYVSRPGSAGPVLLSSGPRDFLDFDSVAVNVAARRSLDGTWSVFADEDLVLEAREDSTALLGGDAFGLWVRHSSLRGRDYYFDDISATSATAGDGTPPYIERAVSATGTDIRIRFNEPVRPQQACRGSTYRLLFDANRLQPVCPDSILVRTVELHAEPRLTPGSYEVSATGVSDAAGNDSGFLTARFEVEQTANAPMPGTLVINEILFAPASGSSEFVELLNRADTPVDLTYMSLSDAQGRSGRLGLDVAPLAPGALLVLAADAGIAERTGPDAVVTVPDPWPGLNNSGDAVVVSWAGRVIDSVAYDSGVAPPGSSLERIDPRKPSSFAGNWAPSEEPEGSSPGRPNSVFAADEVPVAVLAAEALGPLQILLTLTEAVSPLSLSAEHFRAGSIGATSIRTVSDTEFSDGLLLAFPAAVNVPGTELRIERLVDLGGNVSAPTSVPVSLPPAPLELVINEILFTPRSDPTDGQPDQPEYVELYNAAGHSLALTGCVWAGRPDENAIADTAHVAPRPTVVGPYDFAVIVATTDADEALRMLTESFDYPGAQARRVVVLTAPTTPGLRNGGDQVQIVCPENGPIDAVTYEASWHDARLSGTEGIALERIDPFLDSNDPVNWASSTAPSGGTPGLANSVQPSAAEKAAEPGDIVFSEILYEPSSSGLSARVDFVELLNTSTKALNLNGMYVEVAEPPGALPDSTRLAYRPTTLVPGQRALLFGLPASTSDNDEDGVRQAFPGRDEDWSQTVVLPLRRGGVSIPSRPACLALLTAPSRLVDLVCFEPAWHHPHLMETRGVSLERIDPTAPPTAGNWTSALHPSGSTPGLTNSVELSAGFEPPVPAGLSLTPNPFSPDRDGIDDTARIDYRLTAARALVRARVYDSLGRPVRILTPGRASGPEGSLFWNGLDDRESPLPIGIYVVLLDAVDSDSGSSEAYSAALVLARRLR